MPLPTAYTEVQLAMFMHALLGGDEGTPNAIGWTVENNKYEVAVRRTLRAYSPTLTSITEATDLIKLEALATREAWRAVMDATAGEHDYESGTSAFSRSAIAKHARERFLLADAEARVYDSRFATGVTELDPSDNPYRWRPDSERVLPGV